MAAWRRHYFPLCACLRLLLIAYGCVHDSLLEVPYTDVDYLVFTNASIHLVAGRSPYDESEYRYSPVVAAVTAGNVLVHSAFGKVAFALADVACGWVLAQLTGSLALASYWLWNPVVMTVSSRGNAEPLVLLSVLGCLSWLLAGRHWLAGAAYGAAVHLRAYPAIYLPSICLFLLADTRRAPADRIFSLCRFGLAAAGLFASLLGLFYGLYGRDFLHQAYLYHLARVDVQHNFSVYFYILRRLAELADSLPLQLVSKLAFLLQAAAVLLLTVAVRHLPTCWFFVTFAFVSLNKVITSQYFLWYLIFTPLLFDRLRPSVGQQLRLAVAWFLPQAVWLGLAYLLEFRKWQIAPLVWAASVLVLLGNSYVGVRLYGEYRRGLAAGEEAKSR